MSEPIIIRTSERDNVGVAVNAGGIPCGTMLKDGTVLQQDAGPGIKIALSGISKGSPVIRYGEVIGFAIRNIGRGETVNEQLISLPDPPPLEMLTGFENKIRSSEPLEGYSFAGYRNDDGTVGTKNILGISITVNCVSGFVNRVVKRIKEELLPRYPGVDDVIALNHTYGCGVAINEPSSEIPVRTIRNIAANPNLGGKLIVAGLGCEKLTPERLLGEDPANRDNIDGDQFSLIIMQDESFTGYSEMEQALMSAAEARLSKLSMRRRVICPASDLVVGMQCGGSDAFSGITANPVAGYAADLVVRAGGSVIFSEVTEVRDAAHLLIPRMADHEAAAGFIREMKWYDDYLARWGTDRSANPSPGNKRGGLSNVVEKALGSSAKSGTSPIADVIGPGERIRRKGLTFAATPASDFICGTLQLAAGMNMHLFMTGMGSPYGLQMVPVIKISSNSRLSERWHDLIDLDAGQVASGKKSIEEMGWELFRMILEVAGGKRIVAADRLGLHNDLVLFNPGPVT